MRQHDWIRWSVCWGRLSARLDVASGGQVPSVPRMDFNDSPLEASFRQEIRAWLREHLTERFAAIGRSLWQHLDLSVVPHFLANNLRFRGNSR